jgi:hypothetical protein
VLVRDKVKRQEAYFFVAVLETEAKQCFYRDFLVKLLGGGGLDENHEGKRGSVANAWNVLYVLYIL